MSAEWSITSPVALLNQWQGPAAHGDLQDLVLLGFTVNLPFLEKVAIRTARDLGARVTVIGDAAHGVYDPVDVRLRSYFTAWAACRGAFHPKLALLTGDQDIVAAIGSGNPTMAGWGHNDELWTVLRSGPDGSAAGLRQLGEWLDELPQVVAVPGYAADLLHDVAIRLTALPVGDGSAQVLHNLHQGLLGQLPRGPVQELCLYAPFVDQTGRALAEIIDWFDPGRVVIGLQEHWTSYDGDAVLRAAGDREVEIRLLPERYPRHGKLLEWRVSDRRHALTGSANLTCSALTLSTGGGNCELAVLTPVGESKMPEGTCAATAHLQGRRTVSEITPTQAVLLLGALLTRAGLVVTLARAYDVDVTIETSPDGAPGTWTRIGTVPAGQSEAVFPLSGWAGAAVRAVTALPGAVRAESPPVFTVDPTRCARRLADDHRPRLQQSYAEDKIFTDAELARQFYNDLLRLLEAHVQQRAGQSATTAHSRAASPTGEDRLAAYLEECERSIGRPLTVRLFGSLYQLMPRLIVGPGWSIPDDAPDDDDDDDDDADPPVRLVPIMPSERTRWRHWIERLVLAATPGEPSCGKLPAGKPSASEPPVPLFLRSLIARIMIQLLAHVIWDLDDHSWRDTLAQLTVHLVPGYDDDSPPEAHRLAATLAAICMGLLRSGTSLIGGTPADLLAARTWKCVQPLVAEADPDLAGDLLITPIHTRAVVLTSSELEDTILLAMDDPASQVIAELADRGWNVERDGVVYRVSGAFTNPVIAAASVATQLGQHLDLVLVFARAADRWAFIAWRRPDLVLAHVPGNTWRVYHIDGSSTPASRFAGGEGLPSIGLIGRPVRLGQSPPAAVHELLAAAGTDHVALLHHLADDQA